MGGLTTVKVIENLVSELILKLKITNVVVNPNGSYTVSVCKTYYLQEKMPIVIGGIAYTVGHIEIDESIILTGISAPVVGSYDLPAPNFRHGTISMAGSEFHLEGKNLYKKTPVIYLKRPFSENRNTKFSNSPISRTPDLTIYFLVAADFTHWSIDEFDRHAVLPMESLMNEFVNLIENKIGTFGTFENYTIVDRVKFGVVSDKGVDKGYWSDNLSGYELNISLPIMTQCCDC